VHVGDSAVVEIPALADLPRNTFRGLVQQIAWQPESPAISRIGVPQELSGYRVVVELNSTDLGTSVSSRLRRGYAARAKIISQSGTALQLLVSRVRRAVRAVGQ